MLEKNQGAVFSIVFTVGTALAGGFLYVVGYSFLYGYYFGGKDVALFGSSLLPVFVNPVPFDRQGVLITGFIFLVMLAFCIFAYRLLTRLKGDWLLPVVSAVIAFTAVNLPNGYDPVGGACNSRAESTPVQRAFLFGPLVSLAMIMVTNWFFNTRLDWPWIMTVIFVSYMAVFAVVKWYSGGNGGGTNRVQPEQKRGAENDNNKAAGHLTELWELTAPLLVISVLCASMVVAPWVAMMTGTYIRTVLSDPGNELQ